VTYKQFDTPLKEMAQKIIEI